MEYICIYKIKWVFLIYCLDYRYWFCYRDGIIKFYVIYLFLSFFGIELYCKVFVVGEIS